MEILIDIPKKTYKEIQERTIITCGETFAKKLVEYIRNGEPLPEHHGDLISKEQAIELVEFYQLNPQHFDFVNLIDEIKDEKPIIEGNDNE